MRFSSTGLPCRELTHRKNYRRIWAATISARSCTSLVAPRAMAFLQSGQAVTISSALWLAALALTFVSYLISCRVAAGKEY